MSHQRPQSLQGQLLAPQFICGICNYRTAYVDQFRSHCDSANHALQAAATFRRRYTSQNQQERQRNVFFNPLNNLHPPSQPHFRLTTTSASFQSSYLQPRRNLRQSVPRGHTQLAAQGHGAGTTWTRREGWTNAFTRPLIDQLDRATPVIIDLDEDEDDFGPDNMALTLHL